MKLPSALLVITAAISLAAPAAAQQAPAGGTTVAAATAAAFKAAVLLVEETGSAYQVTGSIAHAFKFYDVRPLMVRQAAVTSAERTRIFSVGFRDGARFVFIFDIQPGKSSRVFLADEEGKLKSVMDSPEGGTPLTRAPLPDDDANMADQVAFWVEHLAKSKAP